MIDNSSVSGISGSPKDAAVQNPSTIGSTREVSTTTLSLFIQTLGALSFGVAILFAVGFAPMERLHNAAHDSRHSLAFPCH
ncbi:MAG: CbtB-domain containing protein [Exilibacterium sp.]